MYPATFDPFPCGPRPGPPPQTPRNPWACVPSASPRQNPRDLSDPLLNLVRTRGVDRVGSPGRFLPRGTDSRGEGREASEPLEGGVGGARDVSDVGRHVARRDAPWTDQGDEVRGVEERRETTPSPRPDSWVPSHPWSTDPEEGGGRDGDGSQGHRDEGRSWRTTTTSTRCSS